MVGHSVVVTVDYLVGLTAEMKAVMRAVGLVGMMFED